MTRPLLLVIDADPNAALFVAEVLGAAVAVRTASTLAAGLEAAHALQPAAVLLCDDFPGARSGLDVVGALELAAPRAPVAIAVAAVDAERAGQAEALGCHAFLEKWDAAAVGEILGALVAIGTGEAAEQAARLVQERAARRRSAKPAPRQRHRRAFVRPSAAPAAMLH